MLQPSVPAICICLSWSHADRQRVRLDPRDPSRRNYLTGSRYALALRLGLLDHRSFPAGVLAVVEAEAAYVGHRPVRREAHRDRILDGQPQGAQVVGQVRGGQRRARCLHAAADVDTARCGREALETLTYEPLPDEDFDWSDVPATCSRCSA